MPYRVKELADLVGVSIRTLHHYDEIGLLPPHTVNEAGYRLYSDRELERLQQILFFREIGFSLQDTKKFLDSPAFDRMVSLKTHRELLLQKKKRLEEIIETVNKTIQAVEGGFSLTAEDMFKGFDITSLEDSKKKYTAGGYEHTVTVKTDGTVWGWGNLGLHDGPNVKGPHLLLSNVETVAAASGHYHSFAIKTDGTVWGWGSNDHGQLGTGSGEEYVENPIQVEGLENVVSISAGVFHTLALKTDGTVWTWGPNWYGQLGDNSNIGRKTPAIIKSLANVKDVAAGFFHSMALNQDGTISRWGGYGDSTDDYPIQDESWSPVQVDTLSGIVAIAAGGSHGVALKEDGTVWTWGYNTEGQLGDGHFENDCSIEPRMVVGLTDVKAITAGGAFTMALKKDGTIWAWGSNTYGELGDGTNERKCEAIQISELCDVVQIAAGTKHAMAMKKDGSVWIWGSNDHGQLGDGIDRFRNRPSKCFEVV